MSTKSSAAELAQMYALIAQKRTVTYSSIAAFSLLVYDTLLQFSREYKYIWRTPWSSPKVLYLFIRYYGVAHVGVEAIMDTLIGLPIPICRAYDYWQSIAGAIILTTAVNVVLVLRLHALYRRSVRVLCFLIVASIVEFVLELFITVESLVHTKAIPPTPLFPYPGCLLELTSSDVTVLFLSSWIPTLVISAIFFAMTIWWQLRSHLAHHKEFSPLFSAFVRDGSICFLMIAVILLISSIITIVVKGPLQGVYLPWLIGTYSYAGSRLILNLREAAHARHHGPSWNETMELTTLPNHVPHFHANSHQSQTLAISS